MLEAGRQLESPVAIERPDADEATAANRRRRDGLIPRDEPREGRIEEDAAGVCVEERRRVDRFEGPLKAARQFT